VVVYTVRQRRDAILSPDFDARRGARVAAPRVGVLALQGDFREHRAVLEGLGAVTCEVRHVDDLRLVDGLVIPGGESTVIGKLMQEYGFVDGIRDFAAAGGPVYGSCAGLIIMARAIVEGDQPLLGLMDVVARRNAFGRQVRSFEVDVDVPVLGPPKVRAVFIRAPWIEESGAGVEVLASVSGHAVAARQGRLLTTAFHPELSGETRVHAFFLELVAEHRCERDDDERSRSWVARGQVVS
jgi:5'-phosphate synthase pdxT subunit